MGVIIRNRTMYGDSGGIVDSELSTTSTNPVENNVITKSLNNKAEKDGSNATGTWGIDISGNAETATKDENGDNIVNTYAKKSSVLLTVSECDASTNDEDIAGASALSELKDDFKSIILNSAYPVGTVYMSTKNTSPATFLGGTWSAISSDKYFKTITSGTGGSTGGSTTSGSTTLTVNQIPSHSHSDLMYGTGGGKIGLEYSGASGSNQYSLNVGSGTSITTQTTGGGQGHTHTINPPYYTVYAWVRTA